MNLFAVNQAVKDTKGNPYQIDSAKTLPKFERTSRPISLVPVPEKKPAAADGLKNVTAQSVAAAAPAEDLTPRVLSVGVISERQRQQAKETWLDRVKYFFGLAPKRQTPERAVQTELALDRVKVIRNDLADADWDVVPGTVKSGSTEKPS